MEDIDFDFENLDQAEVDEFNAWLDRFSDQDMADKLDEMFLSGEMA